MCVCDGARRLAWSSLTHNTLSACHLPLRAVAASGLLSDAKLPLARVPDDSKQPVFNCRSSWRSLGVPACAPVWTATAQAGHWQIVSVPSSCLTPYFSLSLRVGDGRRSLECSVRGWSCVLWLAIGEARPGAWVGSFLRPFILEKTRQRPWAGES